MAALLRIIARHPVLAFMVIGLGAGFLTAAFGPLRMPRSCRSTCHYTDSWEVFSASASPHLWSLQRSRTATASLILLGAVCAGASGCAGIWSHYSPFRSGRRLSH